eukprot:TRINITY_DN36764_c0_g1_i1.p1 TRINITY_DN36764_c0_g1~~TRINITY_DN36764_c0_g1_i1.p1  ORF type:complete len:532 (+),score=99.57 TRINITY_DN36764_c0_g1_i1:32-1597(+)
MSSSGLWIATLANAAWLSASMTVFAAGSNRYGQLGLGSAEDHTVPTPIPGLTGLEVIGVDAGVRHSLFLLSNGSVLAAGWNGYGQLGLGGVAEQRTPALVPGLVGVRAVAAGSWHSLFLHSDGTVYTAGHFMNGALGLGKPTSTAGRAVFSPTLISGLTAVEAVAAGMGNSFFLLSNGSLLASGWNGNGELGLGEDSETKVFSPTIVPGFGPGAKQVQDIAAGASIALFLCKDGTVYAAGSNHAGQLGLAKPLAYRKATLLPELRGVKAVAAGNRHSLFLLSSGKVLATGWNGHGQLGLGHTKRQQVPVAIPGIDRVKAVAAIANRSFYLLASGTVLASGWNGHGQSGTGTTIQQYVPTPVPGLSGVQYVVLGGGREQNDNPQREACTFFLSSANQLQKCPTGSVRMGAGCTCGADYDGRITWSLEGHFAGKCEGVDGAWVVYVLVGVTLGFLVCLACLGLLLMLIVRKVLQGEEITICGITLTKSSRIVQIITPLLGYQRFDHDPGEVVPMTTIGAMCTD